MMYKFSAAALIATLLIAGLGNPLASAAAKWPNCKTVNSIYSGGVAKSKAAKNLKTVSGKQVLAKSNFSPKVSSKLYLEMKSLDRDKDGIACEK